VDCWAGIIIPLDCPIAFPQLLVRMEWGLAMIDTVKIRLRSGDAEIELEGSRANVDQLLELWWQKRGTSSPAHQRPAGASEGTGGRGAVRRRSSAQSSDGTKKPEGIDPNQIANQVKESDQFHLIERKILHTPRDSYNKAAFVLWFVGDALTSGAVHRVLDALGVRIDPAAVSRIMKKHLQQFTTTGRRKRGGPPPAYRLTAKAHTEFEKWLNANDAG
jgi:hypothetical protein